jgi:peptide/nickel transport system substrate-binding protein
MRNRTLWLLVNLLLIISLVLVACAGEEATEAPSVEEPTKAPSVEEPTKAPEPTLVSAETAETEPKVLRIQLYSDLGNMDPARWLSLNDYMMAGVIFEGLVRYSANSYDWENQLAEWIEMSEDGLEIDFKLREGIMWQKGYGELTTEDVKFSFERIIDPDVASGYVDDWAQLDHVEIIDKYTGKIILREPQATLWTSTLPAYSGKIICKAQVEEVGDEAFGTNPVGTGPYMFGEWKPGEMIVFVRNPDYWGTPPYWDEIHFIPISDDKVAEVALESGGLDISSISASAVERFMSDPSFNVKISASLYYNWLGMNIENPKLQDINVRKAIRYAVDIPSMLEVAYYGHAEQMTALIPPGMLGHWEDAPLYERDVELAKDYLAKAGIDELDLNLALIDNPLYRSWGEIVQQNLAEIGINVVVEPKDIAEFWSIGEGDTGKELELYIIGYSSMPDPAWFTMWHTCDQVGIWNWMRWCSEEYTDLHSKAMKTIDQEERNQIYIKMEKLFDASVSVVWISHPPAFTAYTTDIQPAFRPDGVLQFEYFQPAE